MKTYFVYIWIFLVLTSIGFPDYQQAMDLFTNKKFEEARKAFLEYAAAQPDKKDAKSAQFYAIKCLFESKQYAELNKEVEALRLKEPDHPALDDLTFLQAYAEQKNMNWNKALNLFEGFVSQFPQSPYIERAREHINTCREWKEPEAALEKNKSDKAAIQSQYITWLGKLYNAAYYEKYLERSLFFINLFPDYPQNDEIMFFQMKSLRDLHQWDQAREKANLLIQQFPQSNYTKLMGGINGRTEDQAAFEFADLVKSYHENNFSGCVSQIEIYLKNYPQNWRLPEVFRYYVFALYHGGNKEKFFEISDTFLREKLNPQQSDHVQFLQAVMLVKQDRYLEAQSMIEELKIRYPDSNLFHKFIDLNLEVLFKKKDYPSLYREAKIVADKYPAGSKEWGVGIIWQGLAKTHQNEPDYDAALTHFESLLKTPLSDSLLDSHTLSTAAIWNISLLEKKGNRQKAVEVLRRVKNEMPDGSEKNKVLDHFKALNDK